MVVLDFFRLSWCSSFSIVTFTTDLFICLLWKKYGINLLPCYQGRVFHPHSTIGFLYDVNIPFLHHMQDAVRQLPGNSNDCVARIHSSFVSKEIRPEAVVFPDGHPCTFYQGRPQAPVAAECDLSRVFLFSGIVACRLLSMRATLLPG